MPAGSVISQSPVAGTQVASGSAVALVVSSGVPQVATPNVVGLTQAAATTAIANAGLTVGAVTTASSTTVPAGSVISQNPVAGTVLPANSAVALVVSSGAAPAALSVDRVVFSDGSGTRVTPAFTTATAGELLVAFASAAGPTSTSLKQTVTVSGAGLTWTLVRRVNAQFGTSEIWSAPAPARLTNATVTATASRSGFDQSLTVVAFIGADGTGATGGASAFTGPSTASLTTTEAGSLVYGVGNDSARATARTLGANQTMTHQFIDTNIGETFWVQSITSPVANSGTVATINDTAPTSDRWNLATVEILKAAAPPPPIVVPNVVGLTQAAATQRDHRRGPDGRRGDHGIEHDGARRLGHQSDAERGHAGRDRQRRRARRLVRSAAGGDAERGRPDAGSGEQRDHRRGPDGRRGDHGIEHDGARRLGHQSDPERGHAGRRRAAPSRSSSRPVRRRWRRRTWSA